MRNQIDILVFFGGRACLQRLGQLASWKEGNNEIIRTLGSKEVGKHPQNHAVMRSKIPSNSEQYARLYMYVILHKNEL